MRDKPFWSKRLSEVTHITVEEAGAGFAAMVARCSGVIAAPAPGVIAQALACAKPCYLVGADGNKIQQAHQVYCERSFIGISAPSIESVAAWGCRVVEQASFLPESGMMMQAARMRNWLSCFEEQASQGALVSASISVPDIDVYRSL